MIIKNKKLSGNIRAVSSKSMAHRHLICALLCDEDTKIYMPNISDDIKSTIDCIKNLGAIVDLKDNFVYVRPKKSDIKNVFNVNESGTTLRFLLPISASLIDGVFFDAKNTLLKRPIKEMVDIMKISGCVFSSDTLPFSIKNKFSFSNVSIRGDISSQYISALLLTSALYEHNVSVNIKGKLESKPYVDMTINTMKEYGVEVVENENGYFIDKKNKYISPKNATVEGDFSSVAFFLVAGAIGDEISIDGLNLYSSQGDRKIIELLEKFGAIVKTKGNTIKVCKNKFVPNNIDVCDIPDLVPILTVLASACKGTSIFYNAKRLRIKESDRIKSSVKMINNLGGCAIEKEEEIIIKGCGYLKGGSVKAYNDHRIAMSTAIASIICKREVFLDDDSVVNKSYPTFFEDFEKLGGKYDR